MDILGIRAITLFATSFLNLILAFVLWYNSKKDKAKLWLGFAGFFSGLFSFFCGATYLFWGSDANISMFWYKTTWLGILMLPCFIVLGYYFIGNVKYLKIKALIMYIIAFIILYLVFTTDLFIKSLKLEGNNIASINGNFDIVGRIYIFFCLIWGLYNLLKNYFKTTGHKKNQLKYFILGASIYFVGGVVSIAIIPFITKESSYYDIAAYFSFIWVALTAYAILKYKLMDIRVITTELFAFALWIILLIKLFASNGLTEIIINSTILLVVIFFGILLIRSVIKEVEQREKIEKIEKELKKAYVVEKQANAELKKLDQYKNDFLRQAQHDLRKPLTAISWYADMLLGGSYGKLSKKALNIIKRMQCVTEGKIRDINNFLDIEQFKMGKGVVLLKSKIEIVPMLDEIVDVLHPIAQEKGIYLKFEKPDMFLSINADKEKLRSAIFNIVDNAVKYTKIGGVIITVATNSKLETLNPKPYILITIKDTGIGIAKDKIESMFKAQFERTELAQKTATGSGVGLYLSTQIIKLHNGKAWAESEGEGKGSIFYIELPIS